jgi:trans-aconitate methyltransferase
MPCRTFRASCYHGGHVYSTNLGSGVLCAEREIRIRFRIARGGFACAEARRKDPRSWLRRRRTHEKAGGSGLCVVAVDSSVAQVEAARKLGLNASVISGEDLQYNEEFDAVFSNAVLHWIQRTDTDVMLAGVYRSLKPGGRFVAECGGHGCVHKIRTALIQALDRRGFDGEARVPWYFPTPGDYATRLERAGVRVDSIALIPRPTPLPGDIVGWLETFALNFFSGFSDEARSDYLHEVQTVIEPQLRDANGTWVADYIRLRFAATKARD